MKVLSGGEKNRMIYGKLILSKPNVLLMDEPTSHVDMESIESLQIALEKFAGTLVFVSHDRELVGGLATRIMELQADGKLNDFPRHLRRVPALAGYRVSDVAPGCPRGSPAFRSAAQRFVASTPSPLSSVANPACFRRFATSFGTSLPLVSLFGVPV